MKKLLKLLFFLTLIISGFVYFLIKPIPSSLPVSSALPSTQPTQVLDQLPLIEFHSKTYRYSYVIIPDPTKLQLFSNHQDQASSTDLIQTHHCSILTNGNFYDTNDQPLGWLVSQGKTISKPITNSLFDGFFSLIETIPSLSTSKVESDVDLGLQSGPILILNSIPLNLTLTADQPRRRVILALNDQSQIIFLVLTGSDSPFSGPLLVDTPALTQAVAKVISQTFISALNLDGGSASAFYSGSIHLKEYSYIGSFFCYNETI